MGMAAAVAAAAAMAGAAAVTAVAIGFDAAVATDVNAADAGPPASAFQASRKSEGSDSRLISYV
jgi:hypothetical protein